MTSRSTWIEVIGGLSTVPTADIDMDDQLAELGIDSLKKVQLIIDLEDNFNIHFDDAELNPGKLQTVKSIYDLIEKYI